MQKLFDILIRICYVLLAFFLAVLVAVTFWQVLCRFVFHIPAAWTEEMVRICFVWLIFIGSTVAVREGTHLMMDVITSHLKGRAKQISNLFILLCMLVVCVVMLVGGIEYVIRSSGKTAVTMNVPANCSYISVPVSELFMILLLLEKLLREIQSLAKGAGE